MGYLICLNNRDPALICTHFPSTIPNEKDSNSDKASGAPDGRFGKPFLVRDAISLKQDEAFHSPEILQSTALEIDVKS